MSIGQSRSCVLNQLIALSIKLFFFFSSRRRHTRLQGDWSSDVCSSDLTSGCESKLKRKRSQKYWNIHMALMVYAKHVWTTRLQIFDPADSDANPRRP